MTAPRAPASRTTGPRVARVHVVVPAHDEERLLPACLAAVAAATTHARALLDEVSVRLTVVLDACADGGAEVCRRRGVDVVETDAHNVGVARRAGVDRARSLAAADGLDPAATWIASTDADSRVPVGWLTDQVALADAGHDLVLGRVEPEPSAPAAVLRRWHELHPAGAAAVHGAHLGVRLAAHDAVGGFAPLREHEDLDLVRRLLDAGARSAMARTTVLTSARTDGRTPGGFAGYLAALTDEVEGGP